MDSWIEDEIARELERMGIEGVDSMEEDDSEDQVYITTTTSDTSSTFNVDKYQTLQASCWDDLEDILIETRTILENNHGCHHTEKTYEGEEACKVTHENSWDDSLPGQRDSISLMSENQTPTIKVLDELKEQEQLQKDQIMKQIQDKDREIQALINEREQFKAKLVQEQRERELCLRNKSCTVIQSHWRGYRSRKLVKNMQQELKYRRNCAATLIQRKWRRNFCMLKNNNAWKIQQCWRHYRCRKIVYQLLRIARENIIHRNMETNHGSSTPSPTAPIIINDFSPSSPSNSLTQFDTSNLNPNTNDNCSVLPSTQNDLNKDCVNDNAQNYCSTVSSPQGDECGSTNTSTCHSSSIAAVPTSPLFNNSCAIQTPPIVNVNSHEDALYFKKEESDQLSLQETEKSSNGRPVSVIDEAINEGSLDCKVSDMCSPVKCSTEYLSPVPVCDISAGSSQIEVESVDNDRNSLMQCSSHASRRSTDTDSRPHHSPVSLEESHQRSDNESFVSSTPYLVDRGEDDPQKQTFTTTSSSVWSNVKTSNKQIVQKALSDLLSDSSPLMPAQSTISSNTSNENISVATTAASYDQSTRTCTSITSTPTPITNSTVRANDDCGISTSQIPHCSTTTPAQPDTAAMISNVQPTSKETLPHALPTCISKSSPCLLVDKTPYNNEQEQQDEWDHVSSTEDVTASELQDMIALRESRSKEECTAQSSRIRMSQMFSAEQISNMATEVRQGETYVARLEHAASPLSPNAWAGVIYEGLKSWQKSSHSLKPSSTNSLSSYSFIRTPSTSSNDITLSNAQILSASPRGTLIDKVALVHVYRSRAPIDLTCLSQCRELCSLFLVKCQLTSFCDIGNENSSLVEVSVPCNVIDTVDFSQIPCLAFLDLSENRLASIHGLSNCSNLLELILDENRIARIGSLQGCEKLQKLSLQGNLIIDAAGISSLHDLQQLSLGENHLPSLTSISNCTVLQGVKLHQNNLQMCPPFTNHCLLRELILSENCLSDIMLLEQAWLPLLQSLDLANNCISSINSLVCCMKLKSLNVEQNNLYDLPGFLHCIRGCYDLTELSTAGNPIEEEPKYRRMVLKAVPGLKVINGNATGTKKKATIPELITNNPLYKLCSRQIHEQDTMKARHLENIRNLNTSDIKCPLVISSLLETKVNDCEEYGNMLRCHLEEQATFDGTYQVPLYERIKIKRHKSATLIQAYWRSYRVRDKYRLIRRSVIIIQTWWRLVKFLPAAAAAAMSPLPPPHSHNRMTTDRRTLAAITIQSHYRGYALRKKLRRILSQIDKEEEEMEEVEISLDESLLSDDFNMRPFTPTDDDINKYLSRQYNSKPAEGVNRVTTRVPVPSPNSDHYISSKSYTIPKYTLPGAAVEDEVVVQVGHGQEVLKQSEISSAQKDATQQRCQQRGASLPPETVTRNGREPDTTWTFNSQLTTNLMKKRAQRHRKLQRAASERSRLHDPSQRLANFKKTNSHVEIDDKPVARSTPRRLSKPVEEPMVFQWSHDKKVVHHEMLPSASGSERISSVDKHYHHHHYASPAKNGKRSGQHSVVLPQLEPHVLAGYTPRLVTSTIQNKLVTKQIDSHSPNKSKHKTDSFQSTSQSSLSSIYHAWN